MPPSLKSKEVHKPLIHKRTLLYLLPTGDNWQLFPVLVNDSSGYTIYVNVSVNCYKMVAAHFCLCCYRDSQEEHISELMCTVEAMKLKIAQLKEQLLRLQLSNWTADVRMTEKSTVTGSLFTIEGTQAQGWLRQSINTISKGNQIRRSCDGTVLEHWLWNVQAGFCCIHLYNPQHLYYDLATQLHSQQETKCCSGWYNIW